MSTAAAQIRRKATIVADYLGKQLRSSAATRPTSSPLLVSMQGPQGCGKSSIAASLVDVLNERGVKCTVASLDDFYLPHSGLRALAAANPTNALLAGRGPPGTHDLELLSSVLADLREGNGVHLPVFDKSLHGGQGDRAGSVHFDSADVFVLEGWSLGFAPLEQQLVKERWEASRVARTHPLDSLVQINDNLAAVEAATEGKFDAHIRIRPPGDEYGVVYAWRLEQEHKMKEKNGGEGMSDDQVRAFVDRYMPVYEIWAGNKVDRPTLSLTFGPEREVLDVAEL